MSTENKQKALDKFNAWMASAFGTKVEEVKEPVEKKFETVLLADGTTEITIEPAIEVGAAVVMTSEDGEAVAAPVGEYPLQDGRVIVIVEDGVLAEVKEAVEEEVEEPMANDKPEQADKVKRIIERIESEKIFAKIEDLEKEVKFLKEENETLLSRFSEVEDKFEDTKTFTKDTFEILYSEPSKEPVVKSDNSIKKFFSTPTSSFDAWMEKQTKKENEK